MALDSLSAAQLPISFGQLRLVEVLDEGSWGRLFRGENISQNGLPAQVAVRILRPPARRDPGYGMNELLVEVQRSRNLRHPAIAQTFACGVDDGCLFVIGELPEGASLAALLEQEGALPLASAVAILAQVGLALQYAHTMVYDGQSQPLYHRHLSPEWIYVSQSGKVRVAGFGVADLMGSLQTNAEACGWALPYASPEVLAGQPISARSDLFSLGALLTRSCLGRVPFGISQGAQKAQYLSGVVRALAEGELFAVLEEQRPGLGVLVQQMVALDPSGRAADLGRVVNQLRGLTEVVPEEFSATQTVGHGGPPSVRAADFGTDSGSLLVMDDEDDADEVETDEARIPRLNSDVLDPAHSVPTDRMSSVYYRQQATAGPPSPPGPAPIGPGASSLPRAAPPAAAPASGSQAPQPGASGPRSARRKKRKQNTPVLPLLAVMAFFALLVFALLTIVYFLKFAPTATDQIAGSGTAEQRSPIQAGDDSPPALEAADDSPPVLEAAGQLEVAGLPAQEDVAEDVVQAFPDSAVAAGVENDGQPAAGDRVSSEPQSVADSSVDSAPPARLVAQDTGTPDELAIRHRPRRRGDAGASDLISVSVVGPADTRVEVWFGPEGGPYGAKDLRARGNGRWEGWLPFDVGPGEVLEYWVVASHPEGGSVYSGAEDQPHRVEVK